MSTGVDGMHVPHAPGGLAGAIRVPPSKSLTQRALVAAALAGEGAAVVHPLDAEDPRLLFAALRSAGFLLAWEGSEIACRGWRPAAGGVIPMGNNGTGARFALAQLAVTPGRWYLDGSARLRRRPFSPLVAALRSLGARISRSPTPEGDEPGRELPLEIEGVSLEGGEVVLDPSASSQFVSALLLLGCRLPRGVVVRLQASSPSRPYLDLTAEVLEAFGARVSMNSGGDVLETSGGGLLPARFEVEGDWSAAAFPMAAVAVAGGEVTVEGVRRDSRQGDAILLDLLVTAGCSITGAERGVKVRGPVKVSLEADLRSAPDLFPALAVVVAVAGGRLTGLAGLAAKESDRLSVMASHLRRLGFAVSVGPDWFESRGGMVTVATPVGPLDPEADHRIAMALAVAGSVVPGVSVADPACVGKSWPGFWDSWRRVVGVWR